MSKHDVQKFYESFDFKTMITSPPQQIQDFLDAEIQFVRTYIKPGKDILEIGCGYGRLLKILAKTAKSATGIDYTHRMVALSSKNLGGMLNVDVQLMDADSLKFRDASFDYVVCLDNTFGNMPGIESKVLKEMTRTCRRGGEVIVSVFSENAKEAQIQNYQRIGLTGIRDDSQAVHTSEGFYSRRFTKKELEELFSSCGLHPAITKLCAINYVACATKL